MKPNHQPRKKSRPAGNPPAGRHTVHFEYSDPSARTVCVAGTFNNWKPETGQMSQAENGKWARDVKLKPGTYEYRLVVDGNWQPDPNANHTVMNPFGERNSLVTVST